MTAATVSRRKLRAMDECVLSPNDSPMRIAVLVSVASALALAGCTTPRIPPAPTTQPTANPWRPYADGSFRGFDSYESGPNHPLRPIDTPATSPANKVVVGTAMHAERRVSTRERVFQGDQFSVNYLVVLASPQLGRVEMLEANAQNVLAQLNRITDRDNGVNEARIEFGDSGNWSMVSVTRAPTQGADAEVRITNGLYRDNSTTARFHAREFKDALVASLQDVERLKRQSIVAP